MTKERPDLPIFYIEEDNHSNFFINIGDRRRVDLVDFVFSFIHDKIQFKNKIRTKTTQDVDITYYTMNCWNCNQLNHLYFVQSNFLSSCNATIRPKEKLWESNKVEYIQEIIDFARASTKLLDEKINLTSVKVRKSGTMQKSYLSFGCFECDSLFGDFHVMEAQIDALYSLDSISLNGELRLKNDIVLNLPHWCFPEDSCFCE